MYICRTCAVEFEIKRNKKWSAIGKCEVCGEQHALFTAKNGLTYEQRMRAAKARWLAQRDEGEDEFLAWLFYHDPDTELFGEWQDRGQRSSYPVTGGVMFCPRPQR